MRHSLKKYQDKRSHFVAKVERFGARSGYKGYPLQTLLLTNVKDENGEIVTDHLWFTWGKIWQSAQVKPGDVVRFCAKARGYWKGLYDEEFDYKLTYPSNVEKVVAMVVKKNNEGALMSYGAIGSIH